MYLGSGDPKERCTALGVTNAERVFFQAMHLKLLYVANVCRRLSLLILLLIMIKNVLRAETLESYMQNLNAILVISGSRTIRLNRRIESVLKISSPKFFQPGSLHQNILFIKFGVQV